MPISLLRFNWVAPNIDANARAANYQASLDMVEAADKAGFMAATVEEHHGVDDGWLPAPLTAAGLMLGRTKNLRVMVQALLAPLNDPIRTAESIAILDLASGGRISVVAGLGYRPDEYDQAGADWSARGALMDETIETIVNAWSGEEFSFRGRKVRVTPTPKSPANAILMVGGSGKPAARRAARFGLPLMPAAHLPWLQEFYDAQCAEHGTQGFMIMPSESTHLTQIAEDPDEAWAAVGHHLLHEATRYQSWQTSDVHSAVASDASSVEELRAEGIYEILSPDEAIARCRAEGDWATFVLHPLCGGTPIERAWDTVNLYINKVLPGAAAANDGQ